MANQIEVLKQTELLGQQFEVYGTLEEPLFKATDVARLINHSDVSTMMRNVDDDEKGTKIVCTPGGNQQVWMLTENGLYEVLMQSRKPIAKEFKKGVKAILKEIRKNGGYMVARADETPEEIMARALVVAKATIERQQKTIEQQQGAIVASQKREAVIEAFSQLPNPRQHWERPISIDELATILRKEGVDTGKKRLTSRLRKKGYISRQFGKYDQPTELALRKHYFEIDKVATIARSGDVFMEHKFMIPLWGQARLIDEYREDMGFGYDDEDEEGGAE